MPVDQIVLVARQGGSTNILYHALAARFHTRVIIEAPPSKWKLARWRAKRVGWIRVAGQLLFQFLVAAPQQRRSAMRRAAIVAGAGCSTAPPPTSQVSRTPSVNSMDCRSQIAALRPLAVVINGTRILSNDTLAAMRVPVLNTHAGITPKYRGVHGAYWALVNGDPDHCGVTVHLVDEGVDTGGILHQALIRPGPQDNFSTYPTLQMVAGSQLLCQAVQEVIAGTARVIEGPAESRRWYHPTLWEYGVNRITKGVR